MSIPADTPISTDELKRELSVAKARIAELERERNYLVNVLYKAREDCIEDNDCCAWLLLNQTCDATRAKEEEK